MIGSTRESRPLSSHRSGVSVRQQCSSLVRRLAMLEPRHGAEGAGVVGLTTCRRHPQAESFTRHLAELAARDCGLRTLLIDASTPARIVESREARAEAVAVEARVADASPNDGGAVPRLGQPTSVTGLRWLDAAVLYTDPDDAHARPLGEVLAEARRESHLVLVQLPPAESRLCDHWVGHLDGVVLVVVGPTTDERSVRAAQQRLRTVGASVLGAIWLESGGTV